MEKLMHETEHKMDMIKDKAMVDDIYLINYGDLIVNNYRKADEAVDDLISSLERFVGDPCFRKQQAENVRHFTRLARKVSFDLQMLSEFIIELEGCGYGD